MSDVPQRLHHGGEVYVLATKPERVPTPEEKAFAQKLAQQARSNGRYGRTVLNTSRGRYQIELVDRKFEPEITRVILEVSKKSFGLQIKLIRRNSTEPSINIEKRYQQNEWRQALKQARQWAESAVAGTDLREEPLHESPREYVKLLAKFAKNFEVTLASANSSHMGRLGVDALVATGNGYKVIFSPAKLIETVEEKEDHKPFLPRLIYVGTKPEVESKTSQMKGMLGHGIASDIGKLAHVATYPSKMADLLNRVFAIAG